MDRTELLTEVTAARSRFESILTQLDPTRMTEPELPGEWSLKDLLAHLGWWEHRAVEIYQELVATGRSSRPMTPQELDAINAEIYNQFRTCSLEQILSYEREAYHAILHLLQIAPDADLFDPRRFAWMNGEPIVQLLLDNSTGHYEEHGLVQKN